jgi:hypothetical protein
MDDYESLSHTKWDCQYRVVFIPKHRRKVPYGELRRYMGDVFGFAEGKPDRGGPPHAGSCAHDDIDPADIRGVALRR